MASGRGVVAINGKKHWLWRAVDASRDVTDILAQSRPNKVAAMRFFCKLFKSWGHPGVIKRTISVPTVLRRQICLQGLSFAQTSPSLTMAQKVDGTPLRIPAAIAAMRVLVSQCRESRKSTVPGSKRQCHDVTNGMSGQAIVLPRRPS